MTDQVDTIIAGGDQGGLLVGYFYKQQGRKHIVLESASGCPDLAESLGLIYPEHAQLDDPSARGGVSGIVASITKISIGKGRIV